MRALLYNHKRAIEPNQKLFDVPDTSGEVVEDNEEGAVDGLWLCSRNELPWLVLLFLDDADLIPGLLKLRSIRD